MACLSISSASSDVKGKTRESERGNEKETGRARACVSGKEQENDARLLFTPGEAD